MNDRLTLQISCLDRLSLAVQQNYIPPVQSILLRCEGDTPAEGLTVSLSFEPQFAAPLSVEIDRVDPGTPVEISPVNIVVLPDFMFSLTERLTAVIHISVTSGGEELCRDDRQIALLPVSEWCGTSVLPELTAAFVTPSHPAVTGVISNASQYLAKWCGEPSFTGYQTRNPNTAKLQAAAVFAALQQENIAYVMAPPGFESTGQKVRTADAVLYSKQANCMDITLLYCSCLEAVGLHPVICIIEGHAFAAVWLEEQSFSECINEDASAITKRAAEGIDELFLVECTAVCAGKNADIERASAAALSHFDDPDRFIMSIDISRCRASGIRPIPLRAEDITVQSADFGRYGNREVTSVPKEIDLSLHGAAAGDGAPLTRLELWERKLLDLSLRNSLLNFRPAASNVQLMTADLAKLEDEISRGESFRILPIPQEKTFIISDNKIFEPENNADKITAIAEAEFKNRRIRSFLSEAELETKLKKLHRSAKSSIEENGANTLYLALGFLRWYESDRSEKPRFAPLILIPVDLVRDLRSRCYSLRIRDEDAQMNITLLEMLRQDQGINITGLDPLPEDESGTDIPLVFSTIRRAVMAKQRWEVEEVAFIGQFSFSRFIMWNDLKNRTEELKANKVVASLISGKPEWQPDMPELTPFELDEAVKPSDMAIPTGADSSQLAAVYAASKGESFVLHGPPGTGKSQTITNLIANALYNGKSVLFVAEKQAALSVVQKRLAKIGLDPFCLELHSNKAQKKAVLGQLEKTLEVGHIKSPEEYSRTAEQLNALRRSFNEDARRLHSPRACGVSLYDAIISYDATGDCKGCISIAPEYADSCTPEKLSQAKAAVSQASAAGRDLGCELPDSPLKNYIMTRYSPEIRDSFAALCDSAAQIASAEKASYERICTAMNRTPDCTVNGWLATVNSCCTLDGMRQGQLQKRTQMEQTFENSVFGVDAQAMKLEVKRAEQKWALPKHFGLKKLAKELDLHAKQPGTVKKDNLSQTLDTLIAYGEDQARFSQYAVQLGLADENAVNELCRLINDDIEPNAAFDELINEKLPRYMDMTEAQQSEDVFGYIISETERMKSGISKLRERTALQAVIEQMKELGLDSTAAALYEGKVTFPRLPEAFDNAFSRAVIDSAFRQDDALGTFSDAKFESEIARYRDTAAEFERLTIQELCAKLSANVPNISSGAGSSEVAVLQKAIRSGGRMLSIRKLFDRIPNLLRRLCPCMLMSPISCAQYIDPAFPKFDLVVFDEASQLPTSEAVGAIARGENVVVVGDPRQLPPTSFFSVNHTDEDNIENEDLESVLDDCLALTMPSKHLLWHYRSRHESLIAFSNARFYENKLLTFPSPDDLQSKVTWVNVEGFYDRSKTKVNRAEAEAVVSEICRRLRDDTLCRDSIGVVTFSIVQQNLIDDLLSEAFIADPSLEARANDMYEPIIIKNLENVQGDERDVILFSIGYGPDKEGKVSMNFGPINRDGGWRRLNVAVSRARKEMKVFSTLRPEQIDLSRSSADGVAELKAFLEYAAKGKQALAVNANSVKMSSDSFAAAVAEELNLRGHRTDLNVGCSGYRVDAAIVNPDAPDRYLLGIVCGGKALLSESSARDRYIGQPSVLRGLGWKLVSVSVLDWLSDRESVIGKITAAAEQALEEYRRPPESSEAPKPAAAPIEFEYEDAPSPLAERCEKYAPWTVQPQGTSKDFYKPENLDKITDSIRWILEAEAPVAYSSVKKRVISAWGISRSGSKVDSTFAQALAPLNCAETTAFSGESFLWTPGLDPARYDGCRVPEPELEDKRPVSEIPPEELANAAALIIGEQVSMERYELMKEMSRLFGFPRMTSNNEPLLAEGINLAVSLGKVSAPSEDRVTAI